MPSLAPLAARPLLKWAGGKRQLLPTLRTHYPEEFAGYVEPFLGSGAVFFELAATGRTRGCLVRLADHNPDLIGCYRMVRDHADEVIAALARLAAEHARRGSAFYYHVRDERFNPARAAGTDYTPELAAMLIYLNRTGYNGLFRVNRRGAFNVPAWRYANPTICDAAHVRAVSAALGTPDVSLACRHFADSLEEAGRGDFVYADPPYAPLSPTARFAQYTSCGFGAKDQALLARAIVAAAGRGAAVVLSNSSTQAVERLYRDPAARATGLRIHRSPARRAINSRASARGAVEELIVTNAGTRRVPQRRMARAELAGTARRRA